MIKKKFGEIPLWILFLSLQLTDIVAFILVFFGVEKAAYRDSDNPFFTNNLDLPYSHSLIGAVLLSAVLYLVLVILKKNSWALIAALSVLSHWIIDFTVHSPDLYIFFGHIKTGLGLWNYPYLSFGLEVTLVIAGWLILGYRNAVSYLLLFLLIGGFSGMFFGKEPDAIKSDEAMRALIVLLPTMLFIVLAYFSERSKKITG